MRVKSHPQRRHQTVDWERFYRDELPSVVYRVHSPSKSHTAYNRSDGFVASGHIDETPTREQFRTAATQLCTTWLFEYTDPSPLVSLTCSFGWAVWQAQRRLSKEEDIEVFFIDSSVLKQVKKPQEELYHAVDLIKRGRANYQALCFASAFDELLVWGDLPEGAVLGRISYKELQGRLPTYFYTNPQFSFNLQPRQYQQTWAKFFTAKGFIQSHEELANRIASSLNLSAGKHANAMYKLAFFVAVQKRWTSVRKIAQALGTWVIDWPEEDLEKFKIWPDNGRRWETGFSPSDEVIEEETEEESEDESRADDGDGEDKDDDEDKDEDEDGDGDDPTNLTPALRNLTIEM